MSSMERPQDPERMKRLLARRERHGWSWPELSRRSGLPVWKLQWWRRRLEAKRPAPRSRRSKRSFLPVRVLEPQPGPGRSVEILTPSGYRIVVPGDVSAEQLSRVVKALEPPC